MKINKSEQFRISEYQTTRKSYKLMQTMMVDGDKIELFLFDTFDTLNS